MKKWHSVIITYPAWREAVTFGQWYTLWEKEGDACASYC